MKVAIIEDEKLSAEHLAGMLQKIDEDIEVVATLDSVRKSQVAFQKGLTADLVFMDIHLADGLSFDLLAGTTLDVPVIFTTAYSEYAIQAFRHNSVDYLLKPIALEELRRAIDKYRKYRNQWQAGTLAQMAEMYKTLTRQYKTRFLVKSGQVIDSIRTDDIAHFATQNSMTFLVTRAGKKYPVDYTLDQLETLLSPEDFFRISRKVIVHIHSIEKMHHYSNGRVIVVAGPLGSEEAVVSRERAGDFKAWLDR